MVLERISTHFANSVLTCKDYSPARECNSHPAVHEIAYLL